MQRTYCVNARLGGKHNRLRETCISAIVILYPVWSARNAVWHIAGITYGSMLLNLIFQVLRKWIGWEFMNTAREPQVEQNVLL